MMSTEHILQVVHRYAAAFTAQDRAAWLANFEEDVEVYEPANAPMRRGRAVFAQVLDDVLAAGMKVQLQPLRIIVNGVEAAVHMQVRMVSHDNVVTDTSVIEIFTLSPAARIARFRAYLDLPALEINHAGTQP